MDVVAVLPFDRSEVSSKLILIGIVVLQTQAQIIQAAMLLMYIVLPD